MTAPRPPRKRPAPQQPPRKQPAAQPRRRVLYEDEYGNLVDAQGNIIVEAEHPAAPPMQPYSPPAAPAPAPAAPAAPATPGKFGSGFSTIRDLICFIAGLAVIGNEVFISATVEAAAVGVGVALSGLPLVFGADEKKKAP